MGDRVTDAVWSFFAAYVALFAVMMLMLMATGLDQVTAFRGCGVSEQLGSGLGEERELCQPE